MRLYEVVKNSLYLRLRYMHVTYHFEKSPGLKIDLIHLGVSWRQEENIWSTDQKFDFQSSMVVISEENTSTLVNGAPYLFVPWRPCKMRKNLKQFPLFYSEIHVLQGEVSGHCPYNLNLFISFTSSPYCELWYSMCRSVASISYLRMMFLFTVFIFPFTFICTLSLGLFLNISSYIVRQVFRMMFIVLSSSVSLSVSLLLQQCLIVLYVFLRSFYVSL